MGCTHARPVTSSKDVHPAPNTTQPPAPSQQGFDIDFPGLIPVRARPQPFSVRCRPPVTPCLSLLTLQAKTLVEEDYELGELLGK